MDRKKMMEARKLSSVGAEETAITHHILPDDASRAQSDRFPVLLTREAVAELLKQVLTNPAVAA